jgi:hypothetical protein
MENIFKAASGLTDTGKKEVYTEALKDAVCTIEFTKVDGSDRIMDCTLKTVMLPETKGTGTAKSLSSDLLRVFDVEIGGWRTITLSKVKSFIKN